MDRNGKVDKKEMTKILEAIYDLLGEEHRKGENSPHERVKTIMKKLDKDQNGYLSEEEFVEGEYFEILTTPSTSDNQNQFKAAWKILYCAVCWRPMPDYRILYFYIHKKDKYFIYLFIYQCKINLNKF